MGLGVRKVMDQELEVTGYELSVISYGLGLGLWITIPTTGRYELMSGTYPHSNSINLTAIGY